MNRIFYKSIFRSNDRSLRSTGRMPWIILHLWGFLCIRDTARRGNKITTSRVMHFEKMPLKLILTTVRTLTENVLKNQAFDCLIWVFKVFFLNFFLFAWICSKILIGNSCSCLLNTCFLLNTVENMEECGTYRPICFLLSSYSQQHCSIKQGRMKKKKKKWPTNGLDSHGPNSVALVPMNPL